MASIITRTNGEPVYVRIADHRFHCESRQFVLILPQRWSPRRRGGRRSRGGILSTSAPVTRTARGAVVMRRVTTTEGVTKGVEPLPPGSQPGVQRPLHHGHQVNRGLLFVSPIRNGNSSIERSLQIDFGQPLRPVLEVLPIRLSGAITPGEGVRSSSVPRSTT